MKNVPARAIQEWMGHADLQTTLGYMHLSPSAVNGAVELLDGAAGPLWDRGRSTDSEVVALQ